jgi:hypothetical protein
MNKLLALPIFLCILMSIALASELQISEFNIYVNGDLVNPGNSIGSADLQPLLSKLSLGNQGEYFPLSYRFPGKITNFNFVNGTALYAGSAITPPSLPIKDAIIAPLFLATPIALITFFDLPEVEKQIRISPSFTDDLISREKNEGISSEEKSELDHYLILEHLLRLAKARAYDFIKEEV